METNVNDDPNQINFAKVPLVALRQRARSILSRSLNPSKVLPSEDGFPRDWRGIAHLAGLQSLYGPVINAERDPMTKVLNLWCEDDNKTANFDSLLKFLGAIDRWDVADNLTELLLEDAQAYKPKKQLLVTRPENADVFKDAELDIALISNPDLNILTRDDVERAQLGLPPQTYDAFVLFAEEDIGFATELIDRMEKDHPRFGFKLCIKDRDLVGGIPFEHEAIMRLIAERCNRLIVIVSAAFLKSSANTFFVNFAQAIQIENRRRKIVPCLYEHCVLPPSLSFYFHLKFHQSGKLFNFWEKLSDSIRSTNAITGPSIEIREITDSNTPTVTATENLSVNTAPIKLPRTKGTKVSATDRMKVQPEPQLIIRNAFSMIQLNAKKPSEVNGQTLSVANCDMNNSETNLSEISSTQSSLSKTTWLKKFLKSGNASSPVSVQPTTKSSESIKKPKNKLQLWKKRLTSSTT